MDLALYARINRDRTHGVSCREAHVTLHYVGSGSCKDSNINASCPRNAYGHLKGGIAENAVSEDDVAFDSSNEHDAVCVAEDDVIDYDVVVGARIDKTDAEVATLACVTIPT